MRTYLFACIQNADCSQMAAAYFNAIADREVACAISAGTEPAEKVHPETVQVMRELGIDLSRAKPQKLTERLAREATLLITLGCKGACPAVKGLRQLDWPVAIPRAQSLGETRVIRDAVRRKVAELVESEGVDGRAGA